MRLAAKPHCLKWLGLISEKCETGPSSSASMASMTNSVGEIGSTLLCNNSLTQALEISLLVEGSDQF